MLGVEAERPIVVFEGKYIITPAGAVISIPRMDRVGRLFGGRVLSPRKDRYGYLVVNLQTHGRKSKTTPIHRLVANAYVDNPDGKPHVNHIDGDKENNHYTNLEWVTAQENT